MTFTSLHDGFTDMSVWDGISYAARWHFLAMANRASRDRRYEEPMPLTAALQCSDVDDPGACLRELHAVGLVDVNDGAVSLAFADDLFPPLGQRPERLQARKAGNKRDQRQRDCDEGRHSKDCPADTCPEKLARRQRVTGDVTGDATVTQIRKDSP